MCSLFNDLVSNGVASNDWMIMNWKRKKQSCTNLRHGIAPLPGGKEEIRKSLGFVGFSAKISKGAFLEFQSEV